MWLVLNMHVAIDLIPSRSNKKTKKKLANIVALIIIMFAFTALVIGGFRLVLYYLFSRTALTSFTNTISIGIHDTTN